MSVSNTYGRKVLYATGYPIMVCASSVSEMRWKVGGITVDWTAVPPLAAASTIAMDGTPVPAGVSVLPLGTVVTKITSSGKYAPYTGAAPGATTLNGGTAVGATSFTLASAASIFPGDMLTFDSGGNLETLRVATVVGNVVATSTPALFTHANAVAVSKVNEGRQLLTPGETFVLNETQLQTLPGYVAQATDNPPGFYGGPVWLQRLLVGGTNQPTLAQLLAACPQIFPVEMS